MVAAAVPDNLQIREPRWRVCSDSKNIESCKRAYSVLRPCCRGVQAEVDAMNVDESVVPFYRHLIQQAQESPSTIQLESCPCPRCEPAVVQLLLLRFLHTLPPARSIGYPTSIQRVCEKLNCHYDGSTAPHAGWLLCMACSSSSFPHTTRTV